FGEVDGGLGSEPIDIKSLRAQALADAAPAAAEETSETAADAPIEALPSPRVPHQAAVALAEWERVSAKPEDEIVIGSIGELGPWGSGRTRAEA
ncbi:hypothetical protein DD702_09280, partial [Bifidobacterium animalis subsp. lactis]|uniref:hypothetical protein n=1 Tax=Bifidobacterium animalis TaxID=28025 RepID=UPI000DE78DC9